MVNLFDMADCTVGSGLRVGLVTFTGPGGDGVKDYVTVLNPLEFVDPEDPIVRDELVSLEDSWGDPYGGGIPEASDEALREILIAGGSSCRKPALPIFRSVPFRAGCSKIAVLITDNVPGGCDDEWIEPEDCTDEDGCNEGHAAALAAEAAQQGVRIAAIYVKLPFENADEDVQRIMGNYATTTNGLYAEVDHSGAGIAAVVAPMLCTDCGPNPPPGECEPFTDCDGDVISDHCELEGNDCNENGVHDACDIANDPLLDCNNNGQIDTCEITSNPSLDCDGNQILDACESITVRVDADAPPGGDGTTWATALNDLQAALDLARPRTCPIAQIWVAEGTYMPDGGRKTTGGTFTPGNGNRSATFQLISDVAIYGGFEGTETSLDDRNPREHPTVLSGEIGTQGSNADNSHHVVSADATASASAVLDGFTIVGGNADDIYAAPNERGGGLYNYRGSPTIRGCRFVGNRATAGGGGGLCSESSLSSPLTVTNCVFSGNISTSNGGGLSSRSNGVDITAGVKLVNCTFSGNSASDRGGGIFVQDYGSGTTLANCILWGNLPASSLGHELTAWGAVAGSTTRVTLSYTDWQYQPSLPARDCGGYAYSGGEIHYQSSDSPGHNIDTDPGFVDPDGPDDILGTPDDDLRLALASSLCVDAGNNAAVPSGVMTDLDGGDRLLDVPNKDDTGAGDPPIVDMGAYEYACTEPTVATITPGEGMQGETLSEVVIGGTGFDTWGAGTVVKLARTGQPDINATAVMVDSATQITCAIALPWDAALGQWDVVVTTCADGTLTDGFEVECGPPTVTSISQTGGNQGQTLTNVAIGGTNFVAPATVTLTKSGETAIDATAVTVTNATQITCTIALPLGAALGDWNVVVTTCADGTLISGFHVCVPLTVTSIDPGGGAQGGTLSSVTIAGTGFADGATVKLTKSGEADIDATSVTFNSATQLTCTITLSLGAALGNWNVVVTTCGPGTLTDGFEVRTPPTVTVFCPPRGVQGTGNRTENGPGPTAPLYIVAPGPVHAVITGTNFVAPATVKLAQSGKADLVATNVVVVHQRAITADISLGGVNDPLYPPGSLDGDWDVVVTSGGRDVVLPTAFTVSMCFSLPVDTDGDGSVDLLVDFTMFRSCFNADKRPFIGPPIDQRKCKCLDADPVGPPRGDGDVDLLDFSVFRSCFNGANRPPACPPYQYEPAPGCTIPSESGPDSLQPDAVVTQTNAVVAQPMTMESLEGVDVTFALASPQAGQTITAGTYVEWHSSVSLTGESQGLGGWDFSLFLGPNTGPTRGLTASGARTTTGISPASRSMSRAGPRPTRSPGRTGSRPPART